MVLLLAALTVRIAWGLAQPVTDEAIDRLPDQREYLALGRNLLQGQGLKFFDPRFAEDVWAFRTPGYPILVAICGGSVRAVRVLQAMLDTSTVLAVFLMARGWLARGAALIAAGAVAANPFLIYFTGLILSESLFTAMLAWGMVFILGNGERARERITLPSDLPLASPPAPHALILASPSWAATLKWLLGGLLLAGAVLVRQSAIGLPIALAVSAAFVNRERGTPYHRRWPLPVGATVVVLTLAVLFPWAWRNYQVLGEWVWTTTNAGITLYDGFNPDADGSSDQSFVRSMPELRGMDELARSEYLSGLAKTFARQQKRRAAVLTLKKAARMWSPMPLSQEYGGWKYRTVGLLYTVPLYLAVMGGLLRAGTASGALPRAAKVFLMVPAIYFTGVHMLSVGSLRYRIPTEPPMAVIAASVVALPAASFKRSGRGLNVIPSAPEE